MSTKSDINLEYNSEDSEYDPKDDSKNSEERYEDDLINKDFDENFEEDISENSILRPSSSSVFVNKEEKYEDFKSTAITFVAVALIGMVFLIINIIGVINLINGLFSYIIFAILCIVFLLIGFSSYNKAKALSLEINDEKNQTSEITTWLTSNITKDNINNIINYEEFDSDEVYFLNVIEKIKDLVKEEFGELDDNYIDRIVEEYYDNNLEG